MEITYMMENYIRKSLMHFIDNTPMETSEEENYLSKDCIQIIRQAIDRLIGYDLH